MIYFKRVDYWLFGLIECVIFNLICLIFFLIFDMSNLEIYKDFLMYYIVCLK